MQIVLEPESSAFNVLFQDEITREGFTIGLNATFSAVEGLIGDQAKLEYVQPIAAKYIKIFGYHNLHGQYICIGENY